MWSSSRVTHCKPTVSLLGILQKSSALSRQVVDPSVQSLDLGNTWQSSCQTLTLISYSISRV